MGSADYGSVNAVRNAFNVVSGGVSSELANVTERWDVDQGGVPIG